MYVYNLIIFIYVCVCVLCQSSSLLTLPLFLGVSMGSPRPKPAQEDSSSTVELGPPMAKVDLRTNAFASRWMGITPRSFHIAMEFLKFTSHP